MFFNIHTTCNNSQEAEKIGQALVRQKLVACVNIIPKVKSIYWWDKKIVNDQESFLMAKTKKEKINQVIKLITKLHSYKLPGISVFKIDKLNPGISTWINQSLNKK